PPRRLRFRQDGFDGGDLGGLLIRPGDPSSWLFLHAGLPSADERRLIDARPPWTVFTKGWYVSVTPKAHRMKCSDCLTGLVENPFMDNDGQ
ncbi:MAG: hypothetical protein ABGY24_06695, partial [bacterium]